MSFIQYVQEHRRTQSKLYWTYIVFHLSCVGLLIGSWLGFW